MDQKFARGLATGLVAVAAFVVFAPVGVATARPLVRRGLKEAVKAYARGREAMAEFQEMAEDAYAEGMAELKAELHAAESEVAAEQRTAATAASEETPVEPKKKGDNGGSVPTGILAHSCASRMRLSFPDKKGDRKFFEALCDQVVQLPGVKEAEGRVLTGSLIVSHDDSSEALVNAARYAGIFDTHEEPPAPAPGGEFEAWKKWADEALKYLGGPGASVSSMASLAFFLMAVTQLARGQTMPPAATALWYAISLLLASRTGGIDSGAAAPPTGDE